MKKPRVVVVGAGIAGLSAALGLAARGVDVTVVERAGAPGGKMREQAVDDSRVDAGPTVLTMRWILDEVFALAGASLASAVQLRELEVLASHGWQDGSRLELFADESRSADAIAAFAGPREARGYREFCARARSAYAALEPAFLRQAAPSVPKLLRSCGLQGLGGLWRAAPFSSLWRALGAHFRDPRLRQLFGRYATYCGSSPFLAPATLMVIAHVEQLGVWRVEGGMYRLAEALAARASTLGVAFRYLTEASAVRTRRGGPVVGIELADGETLDADAVIANADPRAFATGLLGDACVGAFATADRREPSLSALTWSLRARTEGFPLSHHNVFFSPDYAREFREILQARGLPSTPTTYVCAQDRHGPGESPGAAERLFVLVNAPALARDVSLADEDIAACEARTFAQLAACGLRIERTATPAVRTTPHDFATLFPGSRGALYGTATHGWRASFSRPGARTGLRGLYLAGGATHPGAGVPMAALSGLHAADAVLKDLGRAALGAPA